MRFSSLFRRKTGTGRPAPVVPDPAANAGDESGGATSVLTLDRPSGPLARAVDSEAEHDVHAWLRIARDAREAGRADDALSTLEEAARCFPDAAAVRQDLARLAEANRDWPGAEHWWREFALLSPAAAWVVPHIAHFIRLQGRFADAEAWVAGALERWPNEAALFVDHARMAELLRNWSAAADRWATVAERFPDRWEGLAGQARVLREQGDRDQARVLLERAVERFPAAVGLLHERARFAEAERDWPAAERFWREAVGRDPEPWLGHMGLVAALREQGLTEEAESVLTAQFARVPNEAWPRIEYARLAERLGNWPEAMRRWQEVVDRFPERREGYGGRATALREIGQVAEARDVLTEASARFPKDPSVAHDLAWLAEMQHDWAAAEAWWRRFISLEPDQWRGYTGLANTLREQQRGQEADATLADQLHRLGHEPIMFVEYARLAERSGRFAEALDRWEVVASRFAHVPDGYSGQARVLREQGRLDRVRTLIEQAPERSLRGVGPVVVFESDELQVVYERGASDQLLITFAPIAVRPNGQSFFAQTVAKFCEMSALGFVAKRPNWYPAADMRLAREALSGILARYKSRLTYGYSMGAYGAVKFSGLFNAEICVAISPQYSIDPKDVGTFDRSYLHFFKDELHAGMAVTDNEISGDIFILYDQRHEVDQKHMEMYKKSISPILINVPYTGHDTMQCFLGTKIAKRLFEICRKKDLSALRALATAQRKPHRVRAYQACLMAVRKHPTWADRILQIRAGDLLDVQAYELAVRIGDEAARRKITDMAESAFQRANQIKIPADNRATSGLARLNLDLGDVTKAVAFARQAIAVRPDDHGVRAWLASILLRNGDLVGARMEAEAGIQLSAENAPLLKVMSEIAEREGRLDDALIWARRVVALVPDHGFLLERLAHKAMLAHDYFGAEVILLEALENSRAQLSVLRGLATACASQDKYDQAVVWARRACDAAPNELGLREWLAGLLIRAGDFRAACQVASETLHHDPQNVNLMIRLGEAHERLLELTEAVNWIRMAVSNDAMNLHLRERLAHLLTKIGDYDAAEQVLLDSLEINPTHFGSFRSLADIMVRRHYYGRGIHYAQQALDLEPDIISFRDWFVGLLLTVGDLDGADLLVHDGLQRTPAAEVLQRRKDEIAASRAMPMPWVAASPAGGLSILWRRRHEELIEDLKTADPMILFIGDSITAQWHRVGRMAWDEQFGPRGAWEIGISGETCQGLLWRIENGALDGVSPRIVILLIGTNNIGRNTVEDIATGVEQIWQEVANRLPEASVVAVALTPRDADPESWYRHQVNKINQELEIRAARRGIIFVPVADILLRPDQWLADENSPDGLHLSAEGYRRLADRLTERLPLATAI